MTLLPSDWLPSANMKRIHVHWTAGGHKANSTDKKHYHIMIEGDGMPVRGNPPITANEPPLSSNYAAHTKNANSSAIGISVCAMLGARENPFYPGAYPITSAQWAALLQAVAELAVRYDIAVTPTTVLTHAEVQPNLGITQNGKWDITRLTTRPDLIGYKAVGDAMRADVKKIIEGETPQPPGPGPEPVPPEPPEPYPLLRYGDKGDSARTLQWSLNSAGFSPGNIDGDFGHKTQNSLSDFQSSRSLQPNGTSDQETWAALEGRFYDEGPYPVLLKGDKGNAVKAFQRPLGVNADGDFGQKTQNALDSFHQSNGLSGQRVVMKQTWEALEGM